MISVTDTIDGQEYVVSARVGEDGKFSNSTTTGDRTQTISGQVTKSDDNYEVAIDYNSTRVNTPGFRKIGATVYLQEGESQELGGVGNDIVYIRISSE